MENNSISVSTVYYLHVDKYVYGTVPVERASSACLTITESEYKQLVDAGCKHEEYDQIVFAKEEDEDLPFYVQVPIRQCIHKRIVYAKVANHTNF